MDIISPPAEDATVSICLRQTSHGISEEAICSTLQTRTFHSEARKPQYLSSLAIYNRFHKTLAVIPKGTMVSTGLKHSHDVSATGSSCTIQFSPFIGFQRSSNISHWHRCRLDCSVWEFSPSFMFMQPCVRELWICIHAVRNHAILSR